VVALVGLAAFAVGWLLLGTAARVRADREMAARMAAIGRSAPQQTATTVTRPGSGWIPESMSSFGERFARAQGFSEKLDAQLEAAGSNLRSGEFVVGTIGAGLLGAVFGAAFLQNALLAGVIGVVGGLVPTVLLRRSLNRRSDRLREQLPDVLTIMASSLRAGHSFLQALDTVAREIPAPANAEFQRLVAEIRLGRPSEDALEALADRVGSEEFRRSFEEQKFGLPLKDSLLNLMERIDLVDVRIFVTALLVQREVGGNLAEILDNVADTLRERATMRRQIKVLTAEGRLSAWVLALMPFALALYMFAVNREYISLLFTSQVGLIMVGVGGVLLVLGILWMRKIVDIDV
jgi:tight adherence protein B